LSQIFLSAIEMLEDCLSLSTIIECDAIGVAQTAGLARAEALFQ